MRLKTLKECTTFRIRELSFTMVNVYKMEFKEKLNTIDLFPSLGYICLRREDFINLISEVKKAFKE